MKLLTEYLERALHFERLASQETESPLKEALQKQANAYRKLAADQAKKLCLPPLSPPEKRLEYAGTLLTPVTLTNGEG